MQALAHSLTTFDARGGLANSKTFIRKNVIDVSKSTVDFRSANLAGDDDGKYFCNIQIFTTNLLNKQSIIISY